MLQKSNKHWARRCAKAPEKWHSLGQSSQGTNCTCAASIADLCDYQPGIQLEKSFNSVPSGRKHVVGAPGTRTHFAASRFNYFRCFHRDDSVSNCRILLSPTPFENSIDP